MSKYKKTMPPDPITNRIDSVKEAAWRTAMQPCDKRVSEAEKRWGCLERLIEHVSPELARRFGSAWHNLNEAILNGEPEEVAERAAIVMRGVDVLEKEATERGGQPSPEVWGIVVDNVTYMICHRTKDVRAVQTEAEGVQVWSLEELIRVAVSSQAGAYAQIAKGLFKEATVTAVRETEFQKVHDDDLPF